ncbi:hypothetical protein [Nocardia sp. NPDC048505]|uniref:hypothetical protein n=1 Tax=unclassified Nocardia TaxID=2637762 RepID=UPI0033DBF479
MPGVQRVVVSLAEDFLEGDSLFRVSVDLPAADEAQIREVVTRIDARMGRFSGVREREVDALVGSGARVSAGKEFEVEPFLAAVRNVRQYTASEPSGSISWVLRATPSISISDAPRGTAEPLAAIRAMIGPAAAAEVSIRTTERRHWNVELPLPAEREDELRRRLPETRWNADFVVVRAGRIAQLTLHGTEPGPVDPDLDFSRLAYIVRTLDPTGALPLRLDWTWFSAAAGDKRNEGSVHVGGCDYTVPTVAPESLSAEALGVQTRMRQEFDACP